MKPLRHHQRMHDPIFLGTVRSLLVGRFFRSPDEKNLAGGDAAEDALGDDYDMPVIVKVSSHGGAPIAGFFFFHGKSIKI